MVEELNCVEKADNIEEKRRKKMKRPKLLFSILLALIILSCVLAFHLAKKSQPEEKISENTLYKVVNVSDGDTFVIDCDGDEVTVRLLGVDTPESVHPDSEKNSPEGEIASEFTKDLLEGKSVSLKFDEEMYDKYDRVLAYVYLDEKMVNALLLEKGYAKVTIYEPNDKYKTYFQSLELMAKLKKAGFWGEGYSWE